MYEYSCTVDRVVDGDTIDVILDLGFDILYRSRVRLYGIDTPESRTRDKDVDNGSKVVIETKLKDSKGKFGRVLGNVMVDGVNINQEMIDNYLAVAYFGQSKNDIEESHLVNRDKLIELGTFDPSTVGK